MIRRPAVLGLVLTCGWSAPAYAYRPFDSTDADVAKQGEIDLECGPFGYIVEGDSRVLVVPAAILNFGMTEGWELVIEGRNFVRLSPGSGDGRDRIRDAALSVKGMLREGSVQGGAGPSIATELGVLLPKVGDERVGASVAGIVSQRWSAMTVHVNGALLVTHEHALGTFAGAIVEGPFRWTVRPVAEFTVEQAGERTVAALAGAIWQLRDGLALDAGWRVAWSDGARAHELRAGFTWTFPIPGHRASPRRAWPNLPSGRLRA
jgi:hypothetical protein